MDTFFVIIQEKMIERQIIYVYIFHKFYTFSFKFYGFSLDSFFFKKLLA